VLRIPAGFFFWVYNLPVWPGMMISAFIFSTSILPDCGNLCGSTCARLSRISAVTRSSSGSTAVTPPLSTA